MFHLSQIIKDNFNLISAAINREEVLNSMKKEITRTAEQVAPQMPECEDWSGDSGNEADDECKSPPRKIWRSISTISNSTMETQEGSLTSDQSSVLYLKKYLNFVRNFIPKPPFRIQNSTQYEIYFAAFVMDKNPQN
jgi:hypothetical protein